MTVGLRPAGGSWRVAYASSTVTGDESLAGRARINAAQAWQRAARSVGKERSLAQIQSVSATKRRLPGWELLEVTGLSDIQSVRPVAFPTIRQGVIPAHEALVVDNDLPQPEAYRVFVDARTLRVLARQSLVDHSHEGPSPVFTFQGELPAQEGACDTRKGPYTVEAGDHIRAIDVFAGADHPLQTSSSTSTSATRASRRRTRCSRPSGSATRPRGARLRVTTSSRCASSTTTLVRSSRAPTRAR